MHAFDPSEVTVRTGHFIAGEYVDQAERRIEVSRPSDGAYFASIPLADEVMVDRAVQSAWLAQRASGWGRISPRERAAILRRFADLIVADVETLARLESLGSTRPIREAVAWDIPFTAEGIRFYAELADKVGGVVVPTDHDHLGMIVAEPYGVVAAIVPWNFPLVNASWKIAPALAAGNAVVLKPSEMTPFSVLRLAELAILAGVPTGIFNVIQGDGRLTGNALVRHPKVSKVTFTGSTHSGAAIMAACAESGTKPVTLELGGKSPQVVFADAPRLADVARRIANGILSNAGQVCTAGSRLLVERSLAGPLAAQIQAIFADVKAGPTWDAGTTLCPIISEAQAARMDAIVGRTVLSGATLLCGGRRAEVPGDGAFYLPTLLADVTPRSEAVREEIFGPVLTLQAFDSEDEALELAQHPDYGLAAGIHTADIGRALRLMRGIDAGTVWINRFGRTADFIVPTGGFKRSGVGKDLGKEAYEANLRFKSVLIDLRA